MSQIAASFRFQAALVPWLVAGCQAAGPQTPELVPNRVIDGGGPPTYETLARVLRALPAAANPPMDHLTLILSRSRESGSDLPAVSLWEDRSTGSVWLAEQHGLGAIWMWAGPADRADPAIRALLD